MLLPLCRLSMRLHGTFVLFETLFCWGAWASRRPSCNSERDQKTASGPTITGMSAARTSCAERLVRFLDLCRGSWEFPHTPWPMPGDSGSVLLAGDGELVGMRVGVLEQVGTYHPVAINSCQLLAWMIKHDMLNKRKGGFLGSEKLDGFAAKGIK